MWTHAPSTSVPAPVPRLHRATASSRRVGAASRRRGFGFQASQARGARKVQPNQQAAHQAAHHAPPRRFGRLAQQQQPASHPSPPTLRDMPYRNDDCSVSRRHVFLPSVVECQLLNFTVYYGSGNSIFDKQNPRALSPPRSGTDKAPNPAADDQGHPTVGKQKTPPSKIWQRILAPMVTVNLV